MACIFGRGEDKPCVCVCARVYVCESDSVGPSSGLNWQVSTEGVITAQGSTYPGRNPGCIAVLVHSMAKLTDSSSHDYWAGRLALLH